MGGVDCGKTLTGYASWIDRIENNITIYRDPKHHWRKNSCPFTNIPSKMPTGMKNN
jgi:hypothetical protein